MDTSYPIHEYFHTWQGEGIHMGSSAFFIRTHGCPIQCPWCDSWKTWHPDHKKDFERLTPQALLSKAQAAKPDFVVITGGEPTIFDLTPLTDAFHQVGIPVHLETSGAFPIKGDFDWITLSPKELKLPLAENLEKANELKLIVDSPTAINTWIKHLGQPIPDTPIWLHPECSLKGDPEILNLISQTVLKHGSPYRAGYQLHKLYNID